MPDIGSKGERKHSTTGNRKVRWEGILEEEKAPKGHTPSQGEMTVFPVH